MSTEVDKCRKGRLNKPRAGTHMRPAPELFIPYFVRPAGLRLPFQLSKNNSKKLQKSQKVSKIGVPSAVRMACHAVRAAFQRRNPIRENSRNSRLKFLAQNNTKERKTMPAFRESEQ